MSTTQHIAYSVYPNSSDQSDQSVADTAFGDLLYVLSHTHRHIHMDSYVQYMVYVLVCACLSLSLSLCVMLLFFLYGNL